MSRLRNLITYANLMATFAVFMALGGSALAVKQAAKNSVTTASIRDASVTGKDVRDESLTGADVNESTLALPQTARPSGAAGGDLAGNYPSPLIRNGAVGEDEIAPGAVTTERIASNAVTASRIAPASVTSNALALGSVTAGAIGSDAVRGSHIAVGAVGAGELQGLVTATSPGVSVTAGTPRNVSVTCPNGRKLIGGGYSWLDDEGNSIITNAPSETKPDTTWEVRGMVDSGSNTLYAWANCLKTA